MSDSPLSPTTISISRFGSEVALTSQEFCQNIRDTLKDHIPESGICLYCEQSLPHDGIRTHKSCCGSTCWAAISLLSIVLGLALAGDQENNAASILLLQETGDAEICKLFDLMAVVMARCSSQQVQRLTRKLFQRIQKTGRLLTMPRCLYVDSNEMGVSPLIYETGGFAQVWKSKYRGNFVAVKYLRRELDDEHRRRLIYETLLWKSIKHKRLLPLLGVTNNSQLTGMVSPFCEYGSTLSFLQVMIEHGGRYRWGFFYRFLIHRWLLQIAEGLNHLHDKGIVHGDLHPNNILVAKPESDGLEIDILVTDFGLSIYHQDQSNANDSGRGGRDAFIAPELHLVSPTDRPTQKSDCFAWAASAYNLFTMRVPYNDTYPERETKSAIMRGERPSQSIRSQVRGQIYDVTIPEELWELIINCWAHAEERITMKEIIAKLMLMQISVPLALETA